MRAHALTIVGSLVAIAACASDATSSSDRFRAPDDVATTSEPLTQAADKVAWRQARTPTGRSGANMTFFEARGRMVLVAGGNDVALGDMIESDGVRWFDTPVIDGPSPRTSHGLAYDKKRQRLVLFGGAGPEGTTLADTWEHDGTRWTRQAPALHPPGRSSAMITYDIERQRVVLFGGANPSTGAVLGDTWEYDGTIWRQSSPATSPPARSAHGIAYDASRKRVVVFGGSPGGSGAELGDTWEYDGTNWTKFTGSGPPGRLAAPLAYDPERKKVVVFGGTSGATFLNDTWEYDGAAWIRASALGPPARAGHTFAFDPNLHSITMCGGAKGFTTNDFLDDIWQWAGTGWTRSSGGAAIQPSARFYAAVNPDLVRSTPVLFGGVEYTNAFLNETWEWNGTEWSVKSPAARPSARAYHSIAADPNGIVLFGGYSSAAQVLADTWTYNGVNWTKITTTTTPSARAWYGLAYDSDRRRTIMMGGLSPTNAILGDTWEWDGTRWSAGPLARNGLPRYGHKMAYDEQRKKVVSFGGYGSGVTFVDTWEYDGSSWTLMSPLASPHKRGDVALAYDPARKRTVLFGGEDITIIGGTTFKYVFGDTWEYDGVTWSNRQTATSPTKQEAGSLFFDPRRRDLLLFGGLNDDQGIASGDVWRYTWRGTDCGTDADCPGSFCTDGVCCESKACGMCQSCNGADSGRCAPVFNQVDYDSCAGACDATSTCKGGLGDPATNPGDCASGIVADGVCCDSACDGPCMACATGHKESRSRGGVCDFARAGIDLKNNCEAGAEPCSEDGTCDGRGRCRKQLPGVACGAVVCRQGFATGTLCDGFGTCGQNQAGVSCQAYQCGDGQGCKTSCTTDHDCASTHRCEGTQCVARAKAACDGNHTLVAPDGKVTDCAPFKCSGDTCRTTCARVDDCVSPASCGFDNVCHAPQDAAVTPPDDGGGCSVTRAPDARTAWAAFASALVLGMSRRARMRREHSSSLRRA